MSQTTLHASGFGGRIVATLFDMLVLFPLALLLGKLIQLPRPIAMVGAVVYGLMFPFYNIVLLGLFGQTAGKKLAGLRVLLLNGQSIRWRQALLRHSVDLMFSLVLISSWITVLSHSRSLQGIKFYTLLSPSSAFFIWAARFWTAWIWSELIVMFLNRKRRALHDFLAGTWVVSERSERRADYCDHAEQALGADSP